MKTVYISGPMTGYENFNFDEFNRVAALLKNKGYNVINPAEYGIVDGWNWSDYLKKDIADLVKADAVATLDKWDLSRGAKLEVFVAKEIGLDVYHYTDLINEQTY